MIPLGSDTFCQLIWIVHWLSWHSVRKSFKFVLFENVKIRMQNSKYTHQIMCTEHSAKVFPPIQCARHHQDYLPIERTYEERRRCIHVSPSHVVYCVRTLAKIVVCAASPHLSLKLRTAAFHSSSVPWSSRLIPAGIATSFTSRKRRWNELFWPEAFHFRSE